MIELFVIVVGSTVSLITAITCALRGTPVCAFVGLMVVTVACVVSDPELVTKLL